MNEPDTDNPDFFSFEADPPGDDAPEFDADPFDFSDLESHRHRYGLSPVHLAVGLVGLLLAGTISWYLFREPNGSFDAADQTPSTAAVPVPGDLAPPSQVVSADGTATAPTLPPNGSLPPASPAAPGDNGQPADGMPADHAGHGGGAPAAGGTTASTAVLDTTGWDSFDTMNIGASSTPDAIIAEGQPGSVRFACFTSHFNYDDPIVFPGQPGKAHLHMFFGNTLTNSASTAESLRRTGDGTCDGEQLNRSAYWMPALIDRSGNARVAQYTQMYYKAGPMTGQKITPFPDGLRMIAGKALSMNEADNNGVFQWHCGFPGNYPLQYGDGRVIPDCQTGDALTLSLVFPQCWDGENLDSADHQSHMAHPEGSTCPASHPVIVPQITFNIYRANSDTNTGGWYLSSDRHNGMNVPGGTTTHGDWFGAWHPEILQTFVDQCNNQSYDCKGGTISPTMRLLNSPNTGLSDGQDIFNPLHKPELVPVSSIPH